NPNGTETTFPIAKIAEVTGLNNSNQIVGYIENNSGFHGFLYDSGAFTHLNVRGASGTLVSGINDSGEVVGVWVGSSNVSYGFIWTKAQGFKSFSAPHATSTGATAINSAGVVRSEEHTSELQ